VIRKGGRQYPNANREFYRCSATTANSRRAFPCAPRPPPTGAKRHRARRLGQVHRLRSLHPGLPYKQRFYTRYDRTIYRAQVDTRTPERIRLPRGCRSSATSAFHRVDQGRQPLRRDLPDHPRIFGKLDEGEKPLNELISRRNARTLCPRWGPRPNVYYF